MSRSAGSCALARATPERVRPAGESRRARESAATPGAPTRLIELRHDQELQLVVRSMRHRVVQLNAQSVERTRRAVQICSACPALGAVR
jgi:hypothetical protein